MDNASIINAKPSSFGGGQLFHTQQESVALHIFLDGPELYENLLASHYTFCVMLEYCARVCVGVVFIGVWWGKS